MFEKYHNSKKFWKALGNNDVVYFQNLNQKDIFNVNKECFNTGILTASKTGCLDIVQILLREQRFKPEYLYDNAFIEAIRNNHTEIAICLLADPRVRPMYLKELPMIIAIKRGNVLLVKHFLNSLKIDNGARDNFPFKLAVMLNKVDLVKILLECELYHPVSLIHYCLVTRKIEILRIILSNPRVNAVKFLSVAFRHISCIKDSNQKNLIEGVFKEIIQEILSEAVLNLDDKLLSILWEDPLRLTHKIPFPSEKQLNRFKIKSLIKNEEMTRDSLLLEKKAICNIVPYLEQWILINKSEGICPVIYLEDLIVHLEVLLNIINSHIAFFNSVNNKVDLVETNILNTSNGFVIKWDRQQPTYKVIHNYNKYPPSIIAPR